MIALSWIPVVKENPYGLELYIFLFFQSTPIITEAATIDAR